DTSIILKDENGQYHFNGSFRNADMLEEALDRFKEGDLARSVEEEKEKILDLYEQVFDHQSFTGRSGTMYGYEGLGSIYWHMVSKLLLAAEENYFEAFAKNDSNEVLIGLRNHYYEIKAGIGIYKEPSLYGAFPIDAYSHTPGGAGVKQPGLTGQVKEDVISRLLELGVRIIDGKLSFVTSLLHHEETLDKPE
ncbi:MAG: hypothetical protein KDC05_12170, partial [Bacteroidales bacterium]|nr:hypothetical protein [Bacteroidales bacterium]